MNQIAPLQAEAPAGASPANPPPVARIGLRAHGITGYTLLANHPGDRFSPFEPDLAGALREAEHYITGRHWLHSEKGHAELYYQLTVMLRHALHRHGGERHG